MKIAFTVYKIKVCPTQIPLQDRWLLMLIPQNGLIIIEKYSQQFLCLCPTWGAHPEQMVINCRIRAGEEP